MRILITGATGLVGTKLAHYLAEQGHEIVITTRNKSKAQKHLGIPVKAFEWEYHSQDFPKEALEGVDGIVHLMGENISNKRWSDQQKEKILHSRTESTLKLVEAFNSMETKPKAFISTSAIGIYPSNTNEELTEDSSHSNGFLADVCKEWEKRALESQAQRTVIYRFGVVFGNDGGALAKLLPIFKLGGGGPIGSGKAMMSWIHVDDIVQLIATALENANYNGIYNAVSPNPVSNKEFTKALAKAVGMPAFFPVPPLMLKIVFGEMSSIILDSQKVLPKRLNELGHKFTHPNIEEALSDIVKKKDLMDRGRESFHQHFVSYQFIPKDVSEIFEFFSNPYNLEKITPEFLQFRVLNLSTEKIQQGTIINYKLKVHGIPISWRSEIVKWKDGEVFTDVQLKGPYKTWHHTHSFTQVNGGTLMKDEVFYQVPGGAIGDVLLNPFISRDISQIFEHRTKMIEKYVINN